MVIEIFEGYTPDHVFMGCHQGGAYAEQFRKEFGEEVRVRMVDMYKTMWKMATYVNNEIGVECEFTLG